MCNKSQEQCRDITTSDNKWVIYTAWHNKSENRNGSICYSLAQNMSVPHHAVTLYQQNWNMTLSLPCLTRCDMLDSPRPRLPTYRLNSVQLVEFCKSMPQPTFPSFNTSRAIAISLHVFLIYIHQTRHPEQAGPLLSPEINLVCCVGRHTFIYKCCGTESQ